MPSLLIDSVARDLSVEQYAIHPGRPWVLALDASCIYQPSLDSTGSTLVSRWSLDLPYLQIHSSKLECENCLFSKLKFDFLIKLYGS